MTFDLWFHVLSKGYPVAKLERVSVCTVLFAGQTIPQLFAHGMIADGFGPEEPMLVMSR